MVAPTFFPWYKPQWSLRRVVQHPITNFTKPWDDFMVHGVNNPLVLKVDLLLVYQCNLISASHYTCTLAVTIYIFFILFYFIFETEGRQASAKAQEAIHHLTSFPSSREEISQSGFEPPTSSLRFGYPSTITR